MLNDANSYFEDSLSGDYWFSFTDPKKEKALKEAKRTINVYIVNNKIPSDTYHNAIYEQALCFLLQNESDIERNRAIARGVTSISIGHASESYGNNSADKTASALSLCPKVIEMLSSYMHIVITKTARITNKRRC